LEKVLNGILTHAWKRLIAAATMLADEMLDQQWNIAFALTQRECLAE
jgi:hypothetical protein